MIATVTLNSALDRILFVRRFRMGRRIVADDTLTAIGGKGTVVSSLLRRLEADTFACGYAAGPTGHVMCALLDRAGVPYEFVEVDGDTRINTVLVDTEAGSQTTVIAETLKVSDRHIEKLEQLIESKAKAIGIWVLNGSLPPGAPSDLFFRLASRLKDSGATVLLDSSGDGLRNGLRARPFLIKPNLPELEEACMRSLNSSDAIREAAMSLLAEGPEWVVASLGEGGLMAVSAHESYFVPPLPLEVASTSGAGDGVIAGIALGIERNTGMEIAIRLGAAVASSVVTQRSTSHCDPAEVERNFRAIAVERMA